jgi:signal transduction histidine kinase
MGSLPFVYNILIPAKNEKYPSSAWIPVIVPAFMFLSVSLGGSIGFILFILSFYAGSALIIHRIIKQHQNEGIADSPGRFTGDLIQQMIPIIGITGDLIFNSELQKTPIFSVICTVWLIGEIYNDRVLQKKEYSISDIPAFVTPIALISVILPLYGWMVSYLDWLKGPGFTSPVKTLLITGTAIMGAGLYYPVQYTISKILKHFSRRFTDDFTLDMGRLPSDTKPLQIVRVIEKHIPGTGVKFLYRRPFSKAYYFTNETDDAKPQTNREADFLPSKIFLSDIKKKKFSLWNPSNIESYTDSGRFYQKAAKIVEISDLLFVPVWENDALPPALFVLSHKEKKKFGADITGRLITLAGRAKQGILAERSKIFANPADIPSGIYTSEDENSLYSLLYEYFIGSFPVESFSVFEQSDELGVKILYTRTPNNGKISEKQNDSVKEMISVNFLNTRQHAVCMEESGILLIRLQFADNEQRFLMIGFDKNLYYSQGDLTEILAKPISAITAALQRIILFRDIARHRDIMESLYEKLELEKLKIADELHDTVAQDIYASRLLIQMLEKQARESLPESSDDIGTLKSSIIEGLKKTRELIARLRTPEDEIAETTDSILEELLSFIKRTEESTSMEIGVENPELLCRFTPDKAKSIALIIREGINNAKKHSGASLFRARINTSPTGTTLIMADNGRGFDVKEAQGRKTFGLEGIKSKCIRTAGKLKIRTKQGRGTVIRVTGL